MNLRNWAQSLIGHTIDHQYQIEDLISIGGMAALMRAGKSVALKIVPSSEEELVKRLRIEAEAASTIAHPSLIEVYDLGHDNEAAVWYLAERLILGKDLNHGLMERGCFSAAKTRHLFLPIMAGLTELHRHNIIHRDIKLENILLEKDSHGNERAILVDFGLAKLPGVLPTTPNGITMGSPVAMSPEQTRCFDWVGPQSDVWSVGVAIFTLLTGKVPFSRDSIDQTLRAVRRDPVPCILDYKSDLPGELSKIIYKSMRRSLEDRYASMDHFASDLTKCNLSHANYSRHSMIVSHSENFIHTRRM